MPPGMQTWIVALELFFTCSALVMWWTYLIRPWIRVGHITWDGIFLLACCTIWYQDPIDNYFNFTFTYNGHFLNQASWSNFIPGWRPPRGENFAEPYMFMGSFFMWVFFAISVLSCWLLRKFERWLPSLNIVGRFVIIFLIVSVFDFVMESLFTHTGIFAYVAVYKHLSLWAGTPDQFPIYESTGIAAVATGLAMLRYFRDDQGQSFVERGVQKLSVPPPAKRFLSFLALVGAIQLIVLVGFEGDYQWFAVHADSVAKYPSYQMLDICGKGTLYACPASEDPVHGSD